MLNKKIENVSELENIHKGLKDSKDQRDEIERAAKGGDIRAKIALSIWYFYEGKVEDAYELLEEIDGRGNSVDLYNAAKLYNELLSAFEEGEISLGREPSIEKLRDLKTKAEEKEQEEKEKGVFFSSSDGERNESSSQSSPQTDDSSEVTMNADIGSSISKEGKSEKDSFGALNDDSRLEDVIRDVKRHEKSIERHEESIKSLKETKRASSEKSRESRIAKRLEDRIKRRRELKNRVERHLTSTPSKNFCETEFKNLEIGVAHIWRSMDKFDDEVTSISETQLYLINSKAGKNDFKQIKKDLSAARKRIKKLEKEGKNKEAKEEELRVEDDLNMLEINPADLEKKETELEKLKKAITAKEESSSEEMQEIKNNIARLEEEIVRLQMISFAKDEREIARRENQEEIEANSKLKSFYDTARRIMEVMLNKDFGALGDDVTIKKGAAFKKIPGFGHLLHMVPDEMLDSVVQGMHLATAGLFGVADRIAVRNNILEQATFYSLSDRVKIAESFAHYLTVRHRDGILRLDNRKLHLANMSVDDQISRLISVLEYVSTEKPEALNIIDVFLKEKLGLDNSLQVTSIDCLKAILRNDIGVSNMGDMKRWFERHQGIPVSGQIAFLKRTLFGHDKVLDAVGNLAKSIDKEISEHNASAKHKVDLSISNLYETYSEDEVKLANWAAMKGCLMFDKIRCRLSVDSKTVSPDKFGERLAKEVSRTGIPHGFSGGEKFSSEDRLGRILLCMSSLMGMGFAKTEDQKGIKPLVLNKVLINGKDVSFREFFEDCAIKVESIGEDGRIQTKIYSADKPHSQNANSELGCLSGDMRDVEMKKIRMENPEQLHDAIMEGPVFEKEVEDIDYQSNLLFREIRESFEERIVSLENSYKILKESNTALENTLEEKDTIIRSMQGKISALERKFSIAQGVIEEIHAELKDSRKREFEFKKYVQEELVASKANKKTFKKNILSPLPEFREKIEWSEVEEEKARS